MAHLVKYTVIIVMLFNAALFSQLSITGTIKASETNNPIINATIEVFDGFHTYTTKTDSSGNYNIILTDIDNENQQNDLRPEIIASGDGFILRTAGGYTNITVYNILGQEIVKFSAESRKNVPIINFVRGLSSGIYFADIFSNHGRRTIEINYQNECIRGIGPSNALSYNLRSSSSDNNNISNLRVLAKKTSFNQGIFTVTHPDFVTYTDTIEITSAAVGNAVMIENKLLSNSFIAEGHEVSTKIGWLKHIYGSTVKKLAKVKAYFKFNDSTGLYHNGITEINSVTGKNLVEIVSDVSQSNIRIVKNDSITTIAADYTNGVIIIGNVTGLDSALVKNMLARSIEQIVLQTKKFSYNKNHNLYKKNTVKGISNEEIKLINTVLNIPQGTDINQYEGENNPTNLVNIEIEVSKIDTNTYKPIKAKNAIIKIDENTIDTTDNTGLAIITTTNGNKIIDLQKTPEYHRYIDSTFTTTNDTNYSILVFPRINMEYPFTVLGHNITNALDYYKYSWYLAANLEQKLDKCYFPIYINLDSANAGTRLNDTRIGIMARNEKAKNEIFKEVTTDVSGPGKTYIKVRYINNDTTGPLLNQDGTIQWTEREPGTRRGLVGEILLNTLRPATSKNIQDRAAHEGGRISQSQSGKSLSSPNNHHIEYTSDHANRAVRRETAIMDVMTMYSPYGLRINNHKGNYLGGE